MSDIRNISELFKIPKPTADAMRDNLKQLDVMKKITNQLKAVGIVDDAAIKTIEDLGALTKSILENFPVDETTV